MIVIVIVGVVYTLAIQTIKAPQKEQNTPSFLNLKEFLLSFSKDNQSVSLRCEESCKSCSIYSNGKKLQTIKSFFDATVEIYRYDFFQGALLLNRDNCFDFSVDGDGVSDQVIIVYKDKAYDYTPYFSSVKEYDSLESAVQAKEQLMREVQ